MHTIDILIIDDDEDDYLIVKSLLEEIARGPLRLEWASSYPAGEKLLRENRHSVCLMDYQLGAGDGIALLKSATALGFSGPIILLTGIHDHNVDMRALEAGAVDYLVKNGLTAEQLARSIRYALGRRDMELERVERLRAEAESRSKSEFLAHLSHELRTPLSAILGFTELLINSEHREEVRAHLDIVHRNGKHLLGLLNDILDLSKIEAGKFDLEVQPLKLIPFIADIYSLMHSAAMDKNLRFNVTASSDLPEIIHTDPLRLRQVLLNLIGNAIKFTHSGFVHLSVAVVAQDNKPFIAFQVQDSGVGISDANLKAIFKPFVQIKNSRIQTRTGTGLGLTISQQLVQHLGGTIEVTSEVNAGSCFYFTVDPGDLSGVTYRPLTLQMDTDRSRPTPVAQFSGRILVVDDLRDIRLLVGHYMKRCGLQVEYASNGLEALHRIQQSSEEGQPKFDLVLIDIHMPVMDGMTAAREIRKLGYTCPLIALTAAHMKGDQELYLNSGFNGSLSKPIDQAQMIHLLEEYLQPSTGDIQATTSSSPASEAMDLSDTCVLIVEDAPDALAALQQLLTMVGCRTLTASNAGQALQLAQQQRPTHALVDLHLPDIDGYDLSRQLEKLLPDLRIYISSGDELKEGLACRAIRGHLLKPVSLAQLRQIFSDASR